ncbi:hypothetical protein [Salinigranum sp. GCM10025319]|uniref:hypothetical protein n=1 Tax=Salinigranum sp. GCM10025319 TaxID=3252687 RepID=UPI003606B049
MSVETAHAVAVRERDPASEARGSSARADRDEPREEPLWVGVVRSPPAWFRRRVDLLRPRLGLSTETREELDRRTRDLRMQGLCEEGAHNAAWEELGIDDRYRDRLASGSDHLLGEFDALASRERPVVLATDRRPGFRCHRTVLASAIRERRA